MIIKNLTYLFFPIIISSIVAMGQNPVILDEETSFKNSDAALY
jgi:hypothetical protein